jgi:soluble lytic murein transglycosylase-like protein
MRMGNKGIGQAGLTPSQSNVAAMVTQAAQQYGVPVNVALGIASHESGFNPSATHLNANGTTDYGVMQLNDTVLETYGLTPAQALDPQTNINTAVSLLAKYLGQYNGNVDTALWAYASGAGTVAAGGTPNSTATQFIGYVTSYDGSGAGSGSTTTGVDVLGTSLDGTGTSEDDSIDPTTLALVGGIALALYFLS